MPDSAGWFTIGHVTDEVGQTGCTVILFDRLSPAVVDVRGGAPGTRETALLDSGRLVGRADAILLTGGSAFGLAAADGVVRYLFEQGRGFPTGTVPVPIVPAAVIYDLAQDSVAWPSADDGYQAAATAVRVNEASVGQVGAGTGATVAKLGGDAQPAGLGIASASYGTTTVAAVVVLNAVGDIVDPRSGGTIAVATDPENRGRTGRDLVLDAASSARSGENTTIGAVLIDGTIDRDGLRRCCVAAHDALARCVVPAHTLFDGDTFFAAARSSGASSPAEIVGIATATEIAVERAIVSIFAAR